MDLMHDRLISAAYGYTQATPHTAEHWISRVPSAFTVACMCQSTASCSLMGDEGRDRASTIDYSTRGTAWTGFLLGKSSEPGLQ